MYVDCMCTVQCQSHSSAQCKHLCPCVRSFVHVVSLCIAHSKCSYRQYQGVSPSTRTYRIQSKMTISIGKSNETSNATIQSARLHVCICVCFRAAVANLISVKSEHNPCVRPFIRNYLYGCQFSHIGMPCFPADSLRIFFLLLCIESVLHVPNGNGRWSMVIEFTYNKFFLTFIKKCCRVNRSCVFFLFSCWCFLLISGELCENEKQLVYAMRR